jgi:carbon storage regulator CsrA
MLVLTRRAGESIRIGDDVLVTVVQVAPGKVRIGIEAPSGCVILREELIGREPTERLENRPSLPGAPIIGGPAIGLPAGKCAG